MLNCFLKTLEYVVQLNSASFIVKFLLNFIQFVNKVEKISWIVRGVLKP